MKDYPAAFKRYVLPNGLEIHHLYRNVPWVIMKAIVYCGAADDPKNFPGMAHFVEHCVSSNVPGHDYASIIRFFERCGGRAELGGTSYADSVYSFAVPAKEETFLPALNIFGTMLVNATIKEGIETERRVIHREYIQAFPFPESFEWNTAANKALFQGHTLERFSRPLGTPEGFLAIGEKDLQEFYDTNYVPANIVLIVHGGINAQSIIKDLKTTPFGMMKPGKRVPVPAPFENLLPPISNSRLIKYSDHVSLKMEQTNYQAHWPVSMTFSRHALISFMHILDDVLREEIRVKRRLAYSHGVCYSNFRDIRRVEITCNIDPKATDEIQDLVTQCIAAVPQRRDLFEHHMTGRLNSYSMLEFSGSELVRMCKDDLATFRHIVPIEAERKEAGAVTFDQVIEASKLLSPERGFVRIIAP